MVTVTSTGLPPCPPGSIRGQLGTGESTFTEPAAAEPNCTVIGVKFVPVIVTVFPPADGPPAGLHICQRRRGGHDRRGWTGRGVSGVPGLHLERPDSPGRDSARQDAGRWVEGQPGGQTAAGHGECSRWLARRGLRGVGVGIGVALSGVAGGRVGRERRRRGEHRYPRRPGEPAANRRLRAPINRHLDHVGATRVGDEHIPVGVQRDPLWITQTTAHGGRRARRGDFEYAIVVRVGDEHVPGGVNRHPIR